jgi:hypothetical protein
MKALSLGWEQALVALTEGLLLVWSYDLVTELAATRGVLFWLDNWK